MSGETEKDESGWTVDTLNYALSRRIDDLQAMLDERFQTQIKATDAAFAAQQKAMETAFIAADKAVQTALLSAEKAVTKAETAAEKRFEATNEFRGQLSDQAATFMPRSEADAIQQRNAERFEDLKARVDHSEGSGFGQAALFGWLVAGVSLLVTIVLAVSAVLR
jgi:hypothetical protein